jgi:hypothetical protein
MPNSYLPASPPSLIRSPFSHSLPHSSSFPCFLLYLTLPLFPASFSTSLFLFTLLPSLSHSSSFPCFLLYLTLPLLVLPQPTYIPPLLAASFFYPSSCFLIPLDAVVYLSHFRFFLSLSPSFAPIRDLLIRALSPFSLIPVSFFHHAFVSPLFQLIPYSIITFSP